MSYKIKVIPGKTLEEMERLTNEWLAENDVEVLQVIPSLAISTVAVPVGVIQPSPGGLAFPGGAPGPTLQVQVQLHNAFMITIFYEEKGAKKE